MKRTLYSALCVLALTHAAAVAGVVAEPQGKRPLIDPPLDPCAGPISYSNVELLYEYTDFDNGNFDEGGGVVLRYEWEAMEKFHFSVDADYNSYEFTPFQTVGDPGRTFDVEQWTLSVGIGGHIALRENIHLAGDAGFVYSDVSTDFGGVIPGGNTRLDDSETGWFIRPHIRAKWGCLTVHVGAAYYDMDSDSDGWSGYGRLYYQITPSLDLTAGAAFGEEADVYSGGVRWRF